MSNKWNAIKQNGQSLVELALFLPLVITMVVGVAEISQYLIITNRVSTASNMGARFASNGGENQGIASTSLGAVTQTLEIETNRWDIWAIRGRINVSGTAIEDDSWEFEHVYGDELTQSFGDVDETEIRTQVYEELLRDKEGDSNQETGAETQFAGTLVIYDAESILGLELFLQDLYSVQQLNVMRTFPTVSTTNGCSAFPILIEKGQRSLGPGNSIQTFPIDSDYGGSSYPNFGDRPIYDDFPNNVPNVPLEQAREGYIYYLQEGDGQGNFGWVRWNGDVSGQGVLENALTWPGSSTDYTSIPSGNGTEWQSNDDLTHVVYGYINPLDANDLEMHIGDYVRGATGSVNSNGVRTQMTAHVQRGRTLRFIVWEEGATQGTGTNKIYQIVGYVTMRLHAYNLSQGGGGGASWILAEFVSLDDSCGQVNTLP